MAHRTLNVDSQSSPSASAFARSLEDVSAQGCFLSAVQKLNFCLLSWVSGADSSLPSVLLILQKPGARSVCPTLAAGLSVCPWPYSLLPFPRSPVLFPGGRSPGHFILPLPLPHPLYLSVTCLSSGILPGVALSIISVTRPLALPLVDLCVKTLHILFCQENTCFFFKSIF